MTNLKKLDLGEVKTSTQAKVFAGRVRGARCREHFAVESLDTNTALHVRILVPRDTLAITTSFLLSFLGPSIQKAGSEAAFAEKYEFDCPDYIRPSIQEGIERALKPTGSNALTTALAR